MKENNYVAPEMTFLPFETDGNVCAGSGIIQMPLMPRKQKLHTMNVEDIE